MLIYQSGKFDLALRCSRTYQKGAVQPMVYYNIGQIATKCMKKQQAVQHSMNFFRLMLRVGGEEVVQTLIQRLQMS